MLLHTSHPPNTHMLSLRAHTLSQPQHKQGVWYATNRKDKVELSDGGKSLFLTWQVLCYGTKSICHSCPKLEKLYRKPLHTVNFMSWLTSMQALKPGETHLSAAGGHKFTHKQSGFGRKQKWTHVHRAKSHFNQAECISQHCLEHTTERPQCACECVSEQTWPNNTPLHLSRRQDKNS